MVTVTISRENYEQISQRNVLQLSSTAANLFQLINEFAELNRIKDEIILHFLDDQLQNENEQQTIVGISTLLLQKPFQPTQKKVK